MTTVNGAWFAPNSGATTRPVTLKISPSVTGVVPYHNLGSTNGFLGAGTVTLQGHPDVILGTGGNRRFGNSTTDAGKLEDVVLQDLNFYPGIHPIADPTVPTNDSRSGTDQMPFYGQPQPAQGWGQTFQNRDGLQIHHAERLIIRHCSFAYGIDEALSMLRSQGTNNRVIRDILVDHCFIGLGLSNPTDQGVNSEGVPHPLHDPLAFPPHNFGGLVADGDPNDPTKVQNIVFRRCIFACNQKRSPEIGIANGVTVVNSLVVNWGQYGMTIRNPSSDISVPVPTKAIFQNNLFQPGPNSALGSEIGLIRCGTTATQVQIPGNYVISPGNANDWANDALLTAADVDLQPSSGAASNPAAIVSAAPYTTPYTSGLIGTSTPALRQSMYDYLLQRVGPRKRDANGNPQLGDTGTSKLLRWAFPKIKDGTIPHITYPEQATGYAIS